jgi:hypothetical protein
VAKTNDGVEEIGAGRSRAPGFCMRLTQAAPLDRLWCVQTRQSRRHSSPSPRPTGVTKTAVGIAGTGLATDSQPAMQTPWPAPEKEAEECRRQHRTHPKAVVAEGTVVRVVPVAEGGGGVVRIVVPRAAPQDVSGLPGQPEGYSGQPGEYTPATLFGQTGWLWLMIARFAARQRGGKAPSLDSPPQSQSSEARAPEHRAMAAATPHTPENRS